MIFALAEILGLKKFGQADYLGAASGGVGDALESLVQILFWFGAAGHLHQGHAEFVRGHASLLANNIAFVAGRWSFPEDDGGMTATCSGLRDEPGEREDDFAPPEKRLRSG